MNFWAFLDKLVSRWRVEHVAGCGVFLLTVYVLRMLQLYPELADNDLFKMLAQAIIVQGLVGLAMAAWFTTKHRDTVSIDQPEGEPVPTRDVK